MSEETVAALTGEETQDQATDEAPPARTEPTENAAVRDAEETSEVLEREAESSSPDSPKPEPESRLFNDRDTAMDTSTSLFSGEAAMLPTDAGPSRRRPHPLADVPDRLPAESSGPRKIVKASPAVRNLAMRLGVDLTHVKPTGESGRVTREDVQAAAGSSGEVQSRVANRELEAPRRVQGPRASLPEKSRIEFGRTRKIMWKALGDMGTVPHFG